jgi:dolichyl-phosphate beta-glucosyltransferase
MADMRLSVIIPAYNEESRLPETLRWVSAYLARQSYPAEVVVVDDGSDDGTAGAAARFHGARPVSVHRHPDGANHGKGASVKLGMLAATGEYRLFMDADNSTTIEEIERFWPLFAEGYDVVIGSRAIAGARIITHQPRYRELAGRFGNKIIRAMAVPGILDTQVGFKMFTRRSAEIIFPRLTIDRWGFDVEALAIARLKGWRIREMPITWSNAPGSKVKSGAYLDVLREVWRIRRNLRAGAYR